MKVNRTIRGKNADRIAQRGEVNCGRCGGKMSRDRRKNPPFCRDCRASDPQFCQ